MPRKAPTHKAPRTKARAHLAQEAAERQRRRARHTGTRAWQLQRESVLARDKFTCQACGHYGDQVDHIHNDAHIDVDDDRLQTLCRRCHSAKTMRELNAQR